MELPKRKPTRLKEFDYSQNGYYFITICTKDRKRILSKIVGEGSPLPKLTLHGEIIQKYILSIPQKYPNVNFDKYVIMPNHIHIILCIKNGGRGDPSPTVSNVVGWLKYNVTREINEICGVIGTPIFQRSFHDHIIRGEKDYIEICKYIENNPAKWLEDKFYTEQ